MKHMLVALGVLGFACAAEQAQEAQPTAAEQGSTVAGPLEGVWREAEVVITGANAATIQNPQPSLYIFTPTHYAMMGTIGDQPRALYEAADPTTEEKVAAYDSFWGNAGTYEVTGDKVTTRPVIARVPNFMAGGHETFQFRVDGDTLWLTGSSTDSHSRFGEEVVPLPLPASEFRTKLVRVR